MPRERREMHRALIVPRIMEQAQSHPRPRRELVTLGFQPLDQSEVQQSGNQRARYRIQITMKRALMFHPCGFNVLVGIL